MDNIIRHAYHPATNQMRFVDDVENGKKCGCVCTCCNAGLIARQGDINISHFAYSGKECRWAPETSLHLRSKEMIAKAAFIRLPDGEVFHPTAAQMEYRIETLRPDVLLFMGEERLAIEVFVTHEVTPDKRDKLFAMGLRVVQINLSTVPRDIEDAELRNILIEEVSRKAFLWPLVAQEATPAYIEPDTPLAATIPTPAKKWSIDWESLIIAAAIAIFGWMFFKWALKGLKPAYRPSSSYRKRR